MIQFREQRILDYFDFYVSVVVVLYFFESLELELKSVFRDRHSSFVYFASRSLST
jgi:hypothetical protein